ncbi:hypothetical protein J7E73_13865 [Paenibacillus albidus]|uniref:hypothetical protein n=1 Tax=Paenibacillus albidus TaxID=2041023 RepID=UPI001BED19BF|nr:hypothetical protein [Paenibacillus albidus]MBT2290208.1 hypothetical protein [Paenibacillus albidus]
MGALSVPVTVMASPAPTKTVSVSSSAQNGRDISVLPSKTSSNTAIVTPSAQNNGDVSTQNLISNIIKKAITNALRYGGDYLGKLLSKLSPTAGNYVIKYSGQIADFLDSITNWLENIIASGLLTFGIPPYEAYEIAKYIVWLGGL